MRFANLTVGRRADPGERIESNLRLAADGAANTHYAPSSLPAASDLFECAFWLRFNLIITEFGFCLLDFLNLLQPRGEAKVYLCDSLCSWKSAADESAKRTFSFGVVDVFCDTLPRSQEVFI
jgi:hypothetical protein